ncbi:MAG: hypothetical protein KKE24_06850 [Candidatus Thermoplasmatota archaeon]|nr:hypothetical protein [Candidatus Thermoplasmatota archaeon]
MVDITERDTLTHQKVIDRLISLGLTTYEAKVFSALTRLGEARVSEIHTVAEVPRSAIYETLDRLEHRGIIETSTGRPRRFRAVSPKIAISKIESEVMNAVKDAREGLEELACTPPQGASDVRIWAIKGKTRMKERIERMIDSTESELLVAGYPDLLVAFEGLWKMAKGKNTKIRFATTDHDKIRALKKYGEILRPKSKMKTSEMNPPKVLFVRSDKKTILVASEYKDEKQIEDMTAFWTDDKSIVGFINYLMEPVTNHYH